MEFKDIVAKRYAAKKFTGERIPEEKIEALKRLIRLAPSSYNLQPWKIKIVTDKEMKELLSPFSYDQPQITTCSHLLVFCADTDVLANVGKLAAHIRDETHVQSMRQSVERKSQEELLSWAQRQTFLALGNALNGATSLGLDSCPMEGFQPSKYKETLGLPDNLHPLVLCAVGYAADEPREKRRFDDGFL